MTATDLVALIVRWSYSLIAVAALFEYVRHRDQARLDIALMLASLAVAILGGEIGKALGIQSRWLTLATAVTIMAQPYLLLRLVGHFGPLSARVRWLALAGLLTSWLILLIAPTPLPPPLTLVVIVYFVAVEGYATLAFIRHALRARGAIRWRTAFAAAGSGWLGTAILLAGVALVVPALAGLIPALTQLCALFSAVSYYFGFAPPAVLRRAWQLSELHSFLRGSASRPIGERASGTLAYLCPAVTRSIGSLGCAVFLAPPEGEKFVLHGTDRPDWPITPPSTTAGPIASAWRERRPSRANRLSDMDPETARLASATGANALLAVPVALPDRLWGVLVAYRHRPALFPADDVNVLGLFAEQAAEALELGELFNAQQRLVAELEAANKELEAFSYSVSHDLRAPLRAMDGFSQLLLDDFADALPAQAKHYLERVRNNAIKMAQLVDDLLAFSRLGRQPLQLQKIDPAAVARQAWDDLHIERQGRLVQLDLQPLPHCLADGGLLRQVFVNLFSNALKFTRQSPQAAITVGCLNGQPDPTYFVRDNGVGFDPAYTDKLFGVFQRLHRAEDYEGTGVGLAIVQRIIQRHGGRVTAESMPGSGATFYFTLKGVRADGERGG